MTNNPNNNTVGTIKVLVRLGQSTLAPGRDSTVAELSEMTFRFLEELVVDFAIPATVDFVLQNPEPGLPFLISINDEPCRMKRHFGNVPINAKDLAVEIIDIVLENREKLISVVLASCMADSMRDSSASSVQGLHLAGLSRQAYHDYVRLLMRRCFRVDRGGHLSNAAVESPKPWSSQDCFEEAVKSPRNLGVVLHRPPGATNDPTSKTDKSIDESLVGLQDALFYDLGIRVPKVKLREDPLLGSDEIRLQVNDLRLPPTHIIGAKEFLVNDTQARLKLLNIESRTTENPTNGKEYAIVNGKAAAEACRQAGLTTWGRNEYIALAAAAQIRRYGGSFIVLGTVEYELDQLRTEHSGLVDVVVARFELKTIVRLLRYLVDEDISYRNLRGILEALLTTKPIGSLDFSKSIVFNSYAMAITPELKTRGNEGNRVKTFGEAARASLKRYISHKYTKGQSTLIVYLLDPKLESLIRESAERLLTEHERESVLAAVDVELGTFSANGQQPIVLTNVDSRRAFREVTSIEFPNMAVLSYQDLSPDMNIQPIARIALAE